MSLGHDRAETLSVATMLVDAAVDGAQSSLVARNVADVIVDVVL
jgi:hypothetical protein